MTGADLDTVRSYFAEAVPFAHEMGFTVDAVGDGSAVVRFSYDDRWTRPGHIINGGTLMALADLAVYAAIFGRVGVVPLAVTNELKMSFLRPAVDADVLASATLPKLGRRVAYGLVDLATPAEPDRLVAQATATYLLPDEPR